VVVCAPRLGSADGVSIEAAKWALALEALGCSVRTLAGAGTADQLLPELASDASRPPELEVLGAALEGADVVVVENLCSLPLNQAASTAVAEVLAGRPAILHHHDLASQRPALAHLFPPPDDPCWAHVVINDLSAAELRLAGIRASVVRNRFDPDPPPGRRALLRRALGLGDGERLLVHPVRAIPRKNVPAALQIAELAGGVYWLLGPAEDGYGTTLQRLLATTSAPVRRGWPEGRGEHGPRGEHGQGGEPSGPARPFDMHDVYAACDGVLLPSSWEGFGNPAIESATHDRPLVIGDYPVASELRAMGFSWFDAASEAGREAFSRYLGEPDPALLAHNHAVARASLPLSGLPGALGPILESVLRPPVRSGRARHAT
jgi:hypothetical protein